MRIANAEHESRGWRIREIVPDFKLEDVWALPVRGGRTDFDMLLDNMVALDPGKVGSTPTRLLFEAREHLGKLLHLDTASDLPIPGTNERSLEERLPQDLRDTATGREFGRLPFTPLFRTHNEFAGEISNRTVHGVIHLAWAERGNGEYEGQMAIYVKPRGPLGSGYLAFIKPFRYLVVYPALMRQIEREWKARQPT